MTNDICLLCDGRGFYWVKGAIKAHPLPGQPPSIVADIIRAGPKCEACKGSGSHKRATRPVGCGSYLFLALMLFVFFAFVANPLAHLLTRG